MYEIRTPVFLFVPFIVRPDSGSKALSMDWEDIKDEMDATKNGIVQLPEQQRGRKRRRSSSPIPIVPKVTDRVELVATCLTLLLQSGKRIKLKRDSRQGFWTGHDNTVWPADCLLQCPEDLLIRIQHEDTGTKGLLERGAGNLRNEDACLPIKLDQAQLCELIQHGKSTSLIRWAH